MFLGQLQGIMIKHICFTLHKAIQKPIRSNNIQQHFNWVGGIEYFLMETILTCNGFIELYILKQLHAYKIC